MSVKDDAVDDFGDPDRSPRAGLFVRVAHALPYLIAAFLVYSALRWFEIINLPEWAELIIPAPLFLTVIISTMHRELARLCLLCMQQVPADAPTRVKRWLPLLWARHKIGGFRFLIPLAVAIILSSTVATVFQLDSDANSWLQAPADVLLAVFLWAEWKHHRYRPWCPYCRRWDDGDGPREPSPDPTTTGTKVA